jgi:hypothetical protein
MHEGDLTAASVEPAPDHSARPDADDDAPPEPQEASRSGADPGSQDDEPADPDSEDDEPGLDLSQLVAKLGPHRVTVSCAAVLVASVLWKLAFLTHYYFRQDDFEIMGLALKSKLSWGFLTSGYEGHFFPGLFAVAWVLSRAALYNWTVAAGLILVLIAASGLAAWRLLRTLFGDRIEIVFLLALYLLAPVAFETYSLWNAAIESLPMQLAVFTALEAHVRYVRTGKYRLAVTAAAWLALGLAFNEKAAVIPLVLFAVTVGFLTRKRGLLAATRTAVAQWWRAWVLYVGLLVVYAAVLVNGLSRSTVKPAAPASVSAVATFGWGLLRLTVLPGMLGGPWRWFANANTGFAYSWPPAGLALLAAIVVLGLIGAMVLTRRRAWRAWAILAGWIVLADMLPVVLGRLQFAGFAGLFGMETIYVADAPAIVAIAVGLAWLPVAAPAGAPARQPSARRHYFGGRWRPVALALMAVFVVSSLWSVQQFLDVTGGPSAGSAGRAYIANAKLALAQTPAGTVIVNRQLPAGLMTPLFEGYSQAQAVLGPLSRRGAQVTWQGQPAGSYANLKIFGQDGRLYPAGLIGSTTQPLPPKLSCTAVKRSRLVLTFASVPKAGSAFLGSDTTYLGVAYLASPADAGGTATVTYGSISRPMVIRAGVSWFYVPLTGTAAQVIVDDPDGPGLCVDSATVGFFAPGLGSAIPPQT